MTVEHCDLIIRNGTVIDGTGAPRADANVAVADGRIVAVGDVTGTTAAHEIDAAGRIVAPGFIDVHTHDDNAMLTGPDMAPKVSQGVTTVVVGNCGVSLAPLPAGTTPPPPLDLLGTADAYRFERFADYMAELGRIPPAVNAACLVGHSTLRVGAMDALDRPATGREIDVMRDRLGEALDAGALGLSTGLFYAPAAAAPTEEVIALAETLAPVDGIYTTHMRDEGDHVVESIEEALTIGRDAGVRVVISHHKVQGARNFGRTRETLALIERAQRSQRVSLDVYPYIASSTVLLANSRDMAERVVITWSKSMPEFAGHDLGDIATTLGCSRDEAAERLQPAGAIYFSMDEDDVQRVLRFPRTMVGSDGLPHDERPHPRLWGAFPRVLGHYGRELGLFGLEEAVHRMTGLTAGEIGLTGRGVIAPGAAADIVVFDADTIIDRATFDTPTEPAAGIETVIVNGAPVWRDGAPTGARPGRVLKRQELQAVA